MREIVINDSNYSDFVDPIVDGEGRKRGLIPRDYSDVPVGAIYGAKPFDLPLIPEDEWEDRLQERIKQKAQLSDLRNVSGPDGGPIPSRDQDGVGYCWGHSGTSAVMLLRAAMGLPYVDLSAFSVCAPIKDFRDQGGYCGQGVEFMAKYGIASADVWPNQSRDRSLKNAPAVLASYKLHQVTEWMDLDPHNMKAQLVTCLLSGIPVATDFNWWGHSVASVDLVKIKPFRTRIWNSWGDRWSDNGMGILEGSKAVPNGAICPRVITASQE